MRVPPLAVDGSTPRNVLFGGSRFNDDVRGGLRVELGTWLGDDCQLGLQAGYFFLGPDGSTFSASSPVFGAVNRPFIDARTGLPAVELAPGTVTATSSTTGVMGADALLRTALCCGRTCNGSYRFDLLGGYRYFGLNDQLTIRENLVPNIAPFVPGTQITVIDSFRTQNDFHGGSLGAAFVGRRGSYTAELSTRLDLGQMNREVTIFGVTQAAVPGLAPVTRPGGLLAQTSNIGSFRSSDFTLIPEFDLRLGCRLTDRLDVTVGYSFLLFTDVARAGDQIDLVTNPNLLPGALAGGTGPARPAFVLRQTNSWIQGVSLGLTANW